VQGRRADAAVLALPDAAARLPRPWRIFGFTDWQATGIAIAIVIITDPDTEGDCDSDRDPDPRIAQSELRARAKMASHSAAEFSIGVAAERMA